MNNRSQAMHTKHQGRSAARRLLARRAFTIIELVVAMGIATVMMTLINQIFFQTTNAVSRGIGLSHIIGESRAISSTLTTDFIIADKIVKPAAPRGRFIFIGFKTYNNIDFPSARRQGYTQAQTMAGLRTQNVISDQMLLVLDILGQRRTPLTPQNGDTFSPYSFTPADPKNALLWYGHVARLNPNGADAGEIDDPTRNRFGHQWIVGRQLMFLDNTVASAAYADGPYARSPVVGYPSIPTAVVPAINQARWMGLSDIIGRGLGQITGDGSVTPTTLDPTNPIALTNTEYITRVARMAYVTERLRVAATVDPATSFASWNLAQTHPAFMSFCSDFQISFAGDFDSNGQIDTEDSLIAGGTVPRNYQGGSIKWYGYPSNDPADDNYAPGNPIYNPADPRYDDTKPAIYLPTTGGNPGDPIFIDQAALETELAAQVGGSPTAQIDRAIVFRHDASTLNSQSKLTQWPHLIRIRYRLHDERGEIESTNGTARAQGIWFEQIVRIQ